MRPSFKTLALALLAGFLLAAAPLRPMFPEVRPDRPLSFPADHGAHPDYRTEWWYVTGWLKTAQGQDLGFQVTFFRSRLAVDQRNPSAFAPKQILFAHAGLADPRLGRLLHDGRILGGDAFFYYLGTYTSANGRWKGEILNQEHTPAKSEHPIFGGHEVGIGFSGTCDAQSAQLDATALAGKRSLRLTAVLKLMRRA